MNKRIHELFDQSFDKIEIRGTEYFGKFNCEKFAELIVKDTLAVLCEKMDEHHVDLSNLPAWYKAKFATEKYFGVEE